MSRVVIIGGGVAGLAAAARLGHAGHHVQLFESAHTFGGKLGEARLDVPLADGARGAFRFDTGPSLLTWPGVFAELFAETGAPLSSELSVHQLDPVARYRFTDGTSLDFRSDPVELAAEIASKLGPDAATDWAALAKRTASMWRAAQMPFLRRERSIGQILRSVPSWPRLPAIAPGRTLQGMAQRCLRDPRLQMLLERYATYAGGAPSQVPAVYAVIAHLESTLGGWHIEGGLRSLADALTRRAIECGAVLEAGAPVSQILHHSGMVSGVELRDGRQIEADVVASSADAAGTYRMIANSPATQGMSSAVRAMRTRWIGSRLNSAPRSLAGYVLLLGVRGRTPGVQRHNVLFPQRYGQEFEAIFDAPARLPTDPTVYVTVSSDPSDAPADHEAWFVLVNVPRHDESGSQDALDWRDPALSASMEQRVLTLLAARGLPVRERLVFSEVRTPADLQDATWTPGGAIYGTAPHGTVRSLRPANQTPIKGLMLIGGTAHPGGGLPLAAQSAAIAARRIGPA